MDYTPVLLLLSLTGLVKTAVGVTSLTASLAPGNIHLAREPVTLSLTLGCPILLGQPVHINGSCFSSLQNAFQVKPNTFSISVNSNATVALPLLLTPVANVSIGSVQLVCSCVSSTGGQTVASALVGVSASSVLFVNATQVALATTYRLNPFVHVCSCDLLPNACDTGCCCDVLCHENMQLRLALPTHCFANAQSESESTCPSNSSPLSSPVISPNNIVSSAAVRAFLCLRRSNSPYLGDIYNPTPASESVERALTLRSASSTATPISLSSASLTTSYTAGTPIQRLDHNGTRGVFPAPAPSIGSLASLCTDSTNVLFLRNRPVDGLSSSCVRALDTSTTALVDLCSSTRRPNAFSSFLSTAYYAAANDSVLQSLDNFSSATPVSVTRVCNPPSDSCTASFSELSFNATSQVCHNAVHSVAYTVVWNATRVATLHVHFSLGSLSSVSPLASQFFSVSHQTNPSPVLLPEDSALLAGNPGYLWGHTLRFAQPQQHSLSLPPPGTCTTQAHTGVPLRFGVNASSGCHISVASPQKLVEQCDELRQLARTTLDHYLDMSTRVAVYGNSNTTLPLDPTAWLPLLHLSSNFSTAGSSTATSFLCTNVPSHALLTILYTPTGEASNPQHKIVGVRTSLVSRTWAADCPLNPFFPSCRNSSSFSFHVTARVRFLSLSASTTPSRPAVDYLWPCTRAFAQSSGSSQARNVAIVIVLLFACVTIVVFRLLQI